MILRHQGDVLCCKQKLQCFAAQVVIGTIPNDSEVKFNSKTLIRSKDQAAV